jgi:hypothetical protein
VIDELADIVGRLNNKETLKIVTAYASDKDAAIAAVSRLNGDFESLKQVYRWT